MNMEKLLIIEDSQEIRTQLKWGLGKDYSLLLAGDAKEAFTLFKKNQPKVVTLDLGLPPHEEGTEVGLMCLEEIVKSNPLVKVIVITGNSNRESSLKAVQIGAYDYFQKPIDLGPLRVVINRAFYLYHIEAENRRLQSELQAKTSKFEGMLGHCPAMMEVFSTIRKVAPSDVSVLIQGDSGTGKELVARAIHFMSLRKSGSFIPINCGAIPENLIESELFGYEKGSFTGAYAQTQGKVEYAHKGTCFLDEIGELPAGLQVKLLRFLQEKTIQRVGGRDEIFVDARIVAATNVDILRAIEEGKFREDLYYRIGVITIKLPPLRERQGDIMLLANLFLQRSSEGFGKKVRGFSISAINALESYNWPGNVRELENKIQRAVIMSESAVIEPFALGLTEASTTQEFLAIEGTTLREAKDRVERALAISAIEKCGGNIAKAAEELGVSRPTLYDIIKKHGLSDMSVQGQ
jgi:two-component system NtrC family response regulator